MKEHALAWRIWPTPLGPVTGMAGTNGLQFLGFPELSAGFSGYPLRPIRTTSTDLAAYEVLFRTKNQLEEYFNGQRQEFSIPLDLKGTDFQRKVWEALLEIPCGKTRTYKEQTDKLGDPLAIRAVARANGQNPVAILVPCHRVIGSDGKLTGYAGGLPRKRWLLDHEKAMVPSGQTTLF